jgi:hypothetical protein
MSSTLGNMAAEVTYALGNRTDLTTIARTWVNRSYQRLQDTIEFPESHVAATISLAIATSSYALPTDFFSIIDARHMVTERRLAQVSIPRYDRLSLTQTGAPTTYALRARSTILLWPVPDASDQIQLNYRRTLASLIADGDVHVLPVAWEEAIIFGATAYGFEYLNETVRAQAARSSMRAAISQLTDRLAHDLSDRDEPISPIGIQTGVVS